ncbi:MAG: tyrosine--tRNA ligase [Planctomycetota bacterium]|nr:MAG: tyrosine--tRNA ligase [Planctomycetota bacterium]
MDLIEDLRWRGLLHQCTDEAGLRDHLADPDNNPRKVYIGFDPTAPSLTIGNLVQIMNLARVRQAGHIPVVVMGGGTGLIGDPSGKSAERTLMTYETVQEHVRCQRPIFDAVLGAVEGPDYIVFNNADWLMKISYLDALRDIGKFFSVNMMMQKESVKARLENREQGISYTEFSYMILQAYDFAYLYEHEGVTVQAGGSDQFGNIVAGADLIRRKHAARDMEPPHAFGLTAPLVTKADGGKFGKTESGAIWLTADRTSPYAYYQFWLNASDADAANWIKVFTFLDQPTIESIIARHAENPGARELQRTLAREATRILHGQSAMEQAEAAGKALFSGDISALDEPTLREVLADVPSSEKDRNDLSGGYDPVELLVETELAKSKREAREFIANGSVTVNGQRLTPDTPLTTAHLLHGSLMAVRRGKKNWHLIRWS